jgi:hypothetical protein
MRSIALGRKVRPAFTVDDLATAWDTASMRIDAQDQYKNSNPNSTVTGRGSKLVAGCTCGRRALPWERDDRSKR